MGSPSMIAASSSNGLKSATRSVQQSLAASIATIGVPSPRAKQNIASYAAQESSNNGLYSSVSRGMVRGASYATALRVGATADESDTFITDQFNMSSMQSDLLDIQGGGTDSMYGGLFNGLDPLYNMQRPPRSLSEPVIQLPEGLDYASMHGRGVGALGLNPQSPSQPPYQSPLSGLNGSLNPSPLNTQRAIGSPVAQTTPRSPVPPSLGLAWLSTPPSKSLDNSNRNMNDLLLNGNGSTAELFPPLSLPTSSSVDNETGMQAFQRQQFMQSQNASFQKLMTGTDNVGAIGQGQGLGQGGLGAVGIPSPLAWASMLMSQPSSETSSLNPSHQPAQENHYPDPQQAQGFFSHQQHDYQYQQQQQLFQMQQQQQHFQQYGGNTQGGLAYNPFVNQNQPHSNGYQLGVAVSPSPTGTSTESGAASRSGSLVESIGQLSMSDSSGTTDKDELFLYENSLDGDAPEFEPQTPHAAYKAW
jgi:hypothetical protein